MDILLEEIHSGIIKFFEMFQQIVIKFPYFKKKKVFTVEILLKGIFITDFDVKIIVYTK